MMLKKDIRTEEKYYRYSQILNRGIIDKETFKIDCSNMLRDGVIDINRKLTPFGMEIYKKEFKYVPPRYAMVISKIAINDNISFYVPGICRLIDDENQYRDYSKIWNSVDLCDLLPISTENSKKIGYHTHQDFFLYFSRFAISGKIIIGSCNITDLRKYISSVDSLFLEINKEHEEHIISLKYLSPQERRNAKISYRFHNYQKIYRFVKNIHKRA